MTDQDEQLDRLRDAVDRKSEQAKTASETAQRDSGRAGDDGVGATQHSIIDTGRPQDALSARDKNSGHGKKTADKWNQ
jgi:hypothetical protein